MPPDLAAFSTVLADHARIEYALLRHVVEALNFPPLRTEEHPDYLFWSRTCTEEINVNKWLRKVGRPDDYLSFKDEADELMKHLSYVDTLAARIACSADA